MAVAWRVEISYVAGRGSEVWLKRLQEPNTWDIAVSTDAERSCTVQQATHVRGRFHVWPDCVGPSRIWSHWGTFSTTFRGGNTYR